MKKSLLSLAILATMTMGVQSQAAEVVVAERAAQPEAVVVERRAEPAVQDVTAVKEINQLDKIDNNKDVVTEETVRPLDVVEEELKAIMGKLQAKEAAHPSGREYYMSVQLVAANANDPTAFAYAKDAAYTQAYLDILRQMSTHSQKITSTDEQILSQQQGNDVLKFEDEDKGRNKLEAIVEKIGALTDAKLNEALRAAGIDPEQYSSYPPDKRKELLSDKLISKTVATMSERFAGLTIVNNQAYTNKDGKTAVGLIMMYSPKLEALSLSLANGIKPQMKAVGQPIKELIPMNKSTLAQSWGSRVVIDNRGPVVVGYGSSIVNPKMIDTAAESSARRAATVDAQLKATKQIATFLNASYSAQNTTESVQHIKTDLVRNGKTGITDTVNETILHSTNNQRAIAKTAADLKGLAPLYEFMAKGSDGQQYAYCVMTYSYDNMLDRKKKRDAVADAFRETTQVPSKAKGAAASSKNAVDYTNSEKGNVTTNTDVF